MSFGPGGDVEVDLDAVTSKDFARQVEEMKRLMAALGRVAPGSPRTPPSRRAMNDDTMARSLRLTAFAKTANPPEEVMQRYMHIVKREADRAFHRYLESNQALLMEPGDYLSIGMVFLTIYLHRYQDLSHESRNRADLTLYLQQEFNHWDKVIHHDLPLLAVDPRGMLPEQFMQPPVPGSTIEWWNTWESHPDGSAQQREPSYTMPEYVERSRVKELPVVQVADIPHHLVRDLLTKKEFSNHIRLCPYCAAEKKALDEEKKRKVKADLTLTAKLGDMSHDQFVETLSGVMDNPYCDPDASKLATNLFRKHLAKCEGCAVAWEAWEDESTAAKRYMAAAARA